MTAVGSKRVLLTGATGYVGGRLLPVLERRGYAIRCLARRPEFLASRRGASTEVVAGDVLDSASLASVMAGIETAYYLVHSMGSAGSFQDEDRQAAQNFASAAKAAGVHRIIYLGGLGNDREQLSSHLESRHEVGHILRASGIQVVEFRASIVIGAGSLSFELVRALVERLPAMVTPRWVRVLAQPIAIKDLLEYLVGALDQPLEGNPIIEIGGPDQVSYGDLMLEYARQRGLRRLTIPVPVLTPWLSSLWLGLVTPVYARVGRKLIESIRHPTVVRDDSARRFFPGIHPLGVRDAIAQALQDEEREFAAPRWSDALSASGIQPRWGGSRLGNRLIDVRQMRVTATAEEAFAPIRRIGGRTGWYFADWLWRLRGFIDLLVGGVGMRRGRRDLDALRVGDVVDWWRVEAYEPNRLLRLAAEMKLPGRAWLEFEVTRSADATIIQQTAIFDPAGLAGLLYWYCVYPLHQLVFAGMLRGITRRCTKNLKSPHNNVLPDGN